MAWAGAAGVFTWNLLLLRVGHCGWVGDCVCVCGGGEGPGGQLSRGGIAGSALIPRPPPPAGPQAAQGCGPARIQGAQNPIPCAREAGQLHDPCGPGGTPVRSTAVWQLVWRGARRALRPHVGGGAGGPAGAACGVCARGRGGSSLRSAPVDAACAQGRLRPRVPTRAHQHPPVACSALIAQHSLPLFPQERLASKSVTAWAEDLPAWQPGPTSAIHAHAVTDHASPPSRTCTSRLRRGQPEPVRSVRPHSALPSPARGRPAAAPTLWPPSSRVRFSLSAQQRAPTISPPSRVRFSLRGLRPAGCSSTFHSVVSSSRVTFCFSMKSLSAVSSRGPAQDQPALGQPAS